MTLLKRITKKLIVTLLLLSISMTILPLTASASGLIAWGAANSIGDGVRIRSGPGLEFARLAHVSRGEVIVILERTNSEWHKVNYHGIIGYVSVPLLDDPRQIVDFTAKGSISRNLVNLRDEPNVTSTVISRHLIGTEMDITGINNGWYKVEHDGNTGYVRSDFMQILSRDHRDTSDHHDSYDTRNHHNPYDTRDHREVAMVSADTEPPSESVQTVSSDTTPTDTVPSATVPPDTTQSDINTSVTVPPVTVPLANLPTGQQIADYALNYIGYKYVWGGSSPSTGFDCSGFVTYVLRQFDINVSRRASHQYRDNGVHVKRTDLSPGDLVFTSSNGQSVTHVGIYVGDGKFVHASSSRASVLVTDLTTAYYIKHFFGAKRVI
jgi:cell wall-associated NlpC family hydrolase